jgi:hypothetical protein
LSVGFVGSWLLASACEPALESRDAELSPVQTSPDSGLDAFLPEAQSASDAMLQPREAGPPEDVRTPMDAGSGEASKQASAGDAPATASADASLVTVAPDAARADAELATDAATDARDASLPPLETSGPPLETANGAWTYIDFPDTICRDGSRAGISLSKRAPSTKLMIYLEGGIYCIDGLTCSFNPANVDDLLFNSAKSAPTAGIFDRANPANPVRDWNIVYVPYCSGDGHGGTKSGKTDVPGGPMAQYFSGQLNLEKFLGRVAPTFRDATDVLLTGLSAGGFGVLQNLVLVQRAFPWLKVRYVNDSGPPLSQTVAPACMQQRMRTLWGYDRGSLAACGASCPDHDDYIQDNSLFLARTFADRPAGFIDSQDDEPMRMFFGIGLRDCSGSLLFDSVPVETYRADVLAYRDKLRAFPLYGTFIPAGTQHTFLNTSAFYSQTAGGTKLVDWFAKIAGGEAAGHVGP